MPKLLKKLKGKQELQTPAMAGHYFTERQA
jgi:hypothetical protein